MITRQFSALLACCFIVSLVFLKHNSVEQKCDNLLNYGRWSQKYEPSDEHLQWQPFGSMIQVYDKSSISKCLSNRTLYFIGDSTVRQVFWATAAKHDKVRAQQKSAEATKHQDFSYRVDNVSLTFIWDPYLNSTQTKDMLANTVTAHHSDATDISTRVHTAGVIISTGLWYARYSGRDFESEHRQALDIVARYTPKRSLRDHSTPNAYLAVTPVVMLPPPILNHEWLNPERAATLSPQRLANITQNLLSYQEAFGIEVAWSLREMTKNNPAAITSGGLHVARELAAYQAEVILNRVCNNALFSGSNKASSLPCVRQLAWALSSTVYLGAILLVLIVCCLASIFRKQPKLGWQRLQAILVVLLTALCCWLADRTVLFETGNKLVDVKIFLFITAIAFGVGLAHLKAVIDSSDHVLPHSKPREDSTRKQSGLLSREMTEEWKGWMQVVILLYHYFGMSKVLPVYQAIRLLVASYLFLTGYGHGAYFLETKDFSLRRIANVVLRLNFLTCLLSIVMNNKHDFYYFPSLATVWFLITYCVFWHREAKNMPLKELIARMLAMICICHFVTKNERIVRKLLGISRQLYGPDVDAGEFIFRFRLDLVAPFTGMCMATIETRVPTWTKMRVFSLVASRTSNCITNIIKLSISFMCIAAYALVASKFDEKISYNRWHWALSILPIAGYINGRDALRERYPYFSKLFIWVGSISLELFVLQYHIWLAADAKGLLRLGILDSPAMMIGMTVKSSWTYWFETSIVTVIFFWISYHCSRATNTLVQWLIDVSEGGGSCTSKVVAMRLLMMLVTLWLFNFLSGTERIASH